MPSTKKQSTSAQQSSPAISEAPCPVETTLKVLGGRWKVLVLYHLRSDKRRFNELRRLIPNVTQRMLTAHLRELERDGVISRHVFAEVPPRVEYALTATGVSLSPILQAMAGWGQEHAQPTAHKAT